MITIHYRNISDSELALAEGWPAGYVMGIRDILSKQSLTKEQVKDIILKLGITDEDEILYYINRYGK